MRTLLLLIFLLGDTTSHTNTTVYICNGAKGKKYHLKADCRGLSNCQHRIVKMKLEDAQKEGRTLCGWEK